MKRHPIFARVFVLLTRMAGEEGDRYRSETLAPARGRVIEIGAGNGENFAHYPPAVTEVLALEPEPYLRERAREAAARAPVPVRVVDGVADALPGGKGEFDTAVASLVLCSVPDPAHALGEIRRVLAPGGQLLFFEHVLSDDPRRARWQRRVAPLWRTLGGGCNPDRETVAAIADAGFEIERVRSLDLEPGPTRPHVIGVARP